MRKDVIRRLNYVLNKYSLKEDFVADVKSLGISYNRYVTYVEAIHAIRRIWNFYDDSDKARLARLWEDEVVLNRYSNSINAIIAKLGLQDTIKAIRIWQQAGEWNVPEGVKDIMKNNRIPDITAEPSPSPAVTPAVTAKLQITSPKPTLSDTTPLPSPSILSDDGNYEILDFSARKPSANLDEYHIHVICKPGRFSIRFNPYLSELLSSANALNVHIRKELTIGKIFMQFTQQPVTGSLPCRLQNKAKNAVILNSKPISTYLSSLANTKAESFEMRVSKNLSRIPNIITIEINI